MTLSDATGAVETVDVAGRQYRLAPLTMADLGQVEAWARQELMRCALDQLKAVRDVPADVRRDFFREAMDAAASISLLGPSGAPWLQTPGVCIQLVQLSLTRAGGNAQSAPVAPSACAQLAAEVLAVTGLTQRRAVRAPADILDAVRHDAGGGGESPAPFPVAAESTGMP